MELSNRPSQTLSGTTPTGWRIVPLRQVCALVNGRAYQRSEWEKRGVPVIRLQNLTGGQEFYYSNLNLPEYQYCDSGDLLFMWSATFGPRIWRGGRAIYHYHIWKVIPDKSTVDARFLYIKLQELTDDLKTKSSSGGTMLHVTKAQMEITEIALPPLSEQRAIAEALSDVDALIAALDALIDKKRAVETAAMQQLLTGCQRLPGFSGEWKTSPLPAVTLIRKGQLMTSISLVPGSVPVIAGGKNPAYFHAEANRTVPCITISASGASAGYVAFHTGPIFASDCSTIEESGAVTVKYAYYSLLNRQETLYGLQTGGAQPHVQPKDLARLEIAYPPVKEQDAIVTVLSDMDAEIAALEARRDKTRHIKTGMMQELLTGRTRLV